MHTLFIRYVYFSGKQSLQKLLITCFLRTLKSESVWDHILNTKFRHRHRHNGNEGFEPPLFRNIQQRVPSIIHMQNIAYFTHFVSQIAFYQSTKANSKRLGPHPRPHRVSKRRFPRPFGLLGNPRPRPRGRLDYRALAARSGLRQPPQYFSHVSADANRQRKQNNE